MALRCWLEPHCRTHAPPWKKGLWGADNKGSLDFVEQWVPLCNASSGVGWVLCPMGHSFSLLPHFPFPCGRNLNVPRVSPRSRHSHRPCLSSQSFTGIVWGLLTQGEWLEENRFVIHWSLPRRAFVLFSNSSKGASLAPRLPQIPYRGNPLVSLWAQIFPWLPLLCDLH